MGRLTSTLADGVSYLPFRQVNHCGLPGYDPGLQRHHLIPRQALRHQGLARIFAALGKRRIGFNDFRRNGLLLPARDEAAARLSLPLHRGPHRTYNEMVIERLGGIEGRWSAHRRRSAESADRVALRQFARLQRQLVVRLLDERKPLRLHRNCRLGTGHDFALLDAMAEQLWQATYDAQVE